MRKPQQLSRAQSAKQLISTLTGSTALPAFIKTLKTPVLRRLIDYVGLRDSGELIALTTTNQLREVFEEVLWQTLVPGQAEAPRPEMFLQWLDVLLDESPTLAAQRLIELGDTFVVLHFAPLIRVRTHGFDATAPDDDDAGTHVEDAQQHETFGAYIVTATHDDEWDSVRTILVELDSEDASFLQHVLARCGHGISALGFADDGQPLLHDETYAREQRRERSGFVTPQLAALFLRTAKHAELDELVAQTNYDSVSERYFAQVNAASAPAGFSTASSSAAESTAERNAVDEGSGNPSRSDDDADAVAMTGTQRRTLEAALAKAEIIRNDPPPLLLSGPQDSREPVIALQVHLDRLQDRSPEVFSARLGELIFLANVLMAGSWYQSARFNEQDAAQAALACANLGLDYLLRTQLADQSHDGAIHPRQLAAARSELTDDTLREAPGIVRLFQIGWQLTQALPMQCATALLTTLRADHVKNQLKHKRWMLEEIDSAINDPDLLQLIRQGEFEDVSDNMVMLTLVLDPRACQCLRTLIADFPRYPLQLDVGLQRAESATQESGHLQSMRQLEKVEAFLADLDGLLKI